ncbi:hypothetical protein S40285_10196 [Stachybotrys chlorohalonatus IBT 40285]|uniref:Uncharacterized protein n=1 Tax=Stachybotrys chlorohalonatus (strain IBT 40285) TaxID=1283841 RepID=A0A084QQ90_STAC4|nr:hypothetical protein S40285_10196 [Stachybotrys chlorohalonata IBT 40285]
MPRRVPGGGINGPHPTPTMLRHDPYPDFMEKEGRWLVERPPSPAFSWIRSDSLFVARLRDKLLNCIRSQEGRIEDYGREVAEEYRMGSTPPEIQQAYLASLDSNDDDADTDVDDFNEFLTMSVTRPGLGQPAAPLTPLCDGQETLQQNQFLELPATPPLDSPPALTPSSTDSTLVDSDECTVIFLSEDIRLRTQGHIYLAVNQASPGGETSTPNGPGNEGAEQDDYEQNSVGDNGDEGEYSYSSNGQT